MTDREIMQQALEAILENRHIPEGSDDDGLGEVITALREALAQPEQEPVGAVTVSHYKGLENRDFDYWGNLPDGTHNLYTTPPRREWQGLTEEEIESCNQTTTDWGAPCVWLWDDTLEEGGIQFARAIEAKLREKNA